MKIPTPIVSFNSLGIWWVKYSNNICYLVPGLKEEHSIWAPALDLSMNFIGLLLKRKTPISNIRISKPWTCPCWFTSKSCKIENMSVMTKIWERCCSYMNDLWEEFHCQKHTQPSAPVDNRNRVSARENGQNWKISMILFHIKLSKMTALIKYKNLSIFF